MIYRINQDIHKLIQTPTLIKKIRNIHAYIIFDHPYTRKKEKKYKKKKNYINHSW